MAIGIKGLRIDSIDIKADEKENKVDGNYSIISTSDKVIAKQSFNGYNDIKVPLSQETTAHLVRFLAAIKKDAEAATGLAE